MSKPSEIDQPFQPRKHRQEDTELDITPMIDITFLLLSFFVVASKMDPSAAVPVPQAQFGMTVSEKNCVVVIVLEGDTPDTAKIFKGRSTDPKDMFQDAEPTVMEEAIGQYVDSELSRRPNVEGILVKAGGTVKTGLVEMVKRGAMNTEMAKDHKLYIGVEESK
jgi:biopolymer transport protein ExbD